MLTVAEYRHPEAVQSLRRLWDELWRQTPEASLFQTYEWYVECLRQGKSDCEPRVMRVSIEGRDVGLVPFLARSVRTLFGRARVLTLPGGEFGLPGGAVGRHCAINWLAVARHLQTIQRDWDAVDLTAETAAEHRIHAAFRSAGMRTRRLAVGSIPAVDLRFGWRSYWNSRDASLWRRCLQAERRLRTQADVRFVRFRPARRRAKPAMRWDLFSAFLRAAHRNAFPVNGHTLLRAQDQQELSRVHEIGVPLGLVDLCLLYVDNRPLAAAYCLRRGGALRALRIGRARGATRDVSDVLLAHLLRDCVRLGDGSLHFGVRNSEQSRQWATHCERATRLTHFAPLKPSAQLLRLGRWWHGGHPPQKQLAPHAAHRSADQSLTEAAVLRLRS